MCMFMYIDMKLKCSPCDRAPLPQVPVQAPPRWEEAPTTGDTRYPAGYVASHRG